MNIIYECEICFYRSRDKKKVQECEAQGSKHKFSVGQKVLFLFGPLGDKIWMKATVEFIRFRKRTHAVSYRLKSHDEKLPAHIHNHALITSERNVRSIS